MCNEILNQVPSLIDTQFTDNDGNLYTLLWQDIDYVMSMGSNGEDTSTCVVLMDENNEVLVVQEEYFDNNFDVYVENSPQTDMFYMDNDPEYN